MRYQGRITDWNDARGFGFVTPIGGGDRAFVHVRAFERLGRRPASGDLIAYTVRRDAKGRLTAAEVRFAGAGAQREAVPGGGLPRRSLAVTAFVVLFAAGWLHRLPLGIVGYYVAMSAVAFIAYAIDKSAARNGRWRIPESYLHAVALLGGWPGALLAQGVFRHKSRKAQFQGMFWITVVLNCAGLAWVLRTVLLPG